MGLLHIASHEAGYTLGLSKVGIAGIGSTWRLRLHEEGEGTMAKVFISYRREDSASVSGRIYDQLVAKFGRKNVFKDVDNIPGGAKFGTNIQESLRQCAVSLVVIGQHWLDIQAADGGRRLDDPTDWVRIEVETALSLGLTVIPILVEGAGMPKATQLPAPLQELTQRQYLVVPNDPDFSHGMKRVISALKRALGSRTPRRRGPSSNRPLLADLRLFTHPFILLEAVIAEGAVLLSTGIVFGQVNSPLSTRIALANGLGQAGLVIAVIAWITAMYLSYRYKQWGWLIGLLLLGVALYTRATFSDDFLSYCLIGVVPGLFGVFGPGATRARGGIS